MITRHRIALVAVLATVPFAVLGCSSSGNSGAAGPRAATATASTASAKPSASTSSDTKPTEEDSKPTDEDSKPTDKDTTPADEDSKSSTSDPTADTTSPSQAKAAKGDGKFPDSCSLLTQDDAKAALGEAVDPGEMVPLAGGGGTCTFGASAGENNGKDVVAQIGPVDLIRTAVAGHKTQAVSGLGDEAEVYGMGGNIFNIFVVKGSTAIDINIAKGGDIYAPEAVPPQPVADALKTLAKTALSHL